MAKAKTTISMNNFLFEYFDYSHGSQGINKQEEAIGSLSFSKAS